MNNKSFNSLNLTRFYFFSFAVLVITGLLFKCLFVIYNYSHLSSLSSGEIIYALFWGLRFDFASAALFTLLSCFVLWVFCRFLTRNKPPAIFLLSISVITQASMQLGDMLYFIEAGRHASYEMRDVLTDASGLFFTAVFKHGLVILFAYLLILVLVLIVKRLVMAFPLLFVDNAWLQSFKLKHEFRLFIIILMSVIFIRSGFIGLPLSVTSAFKIGDAQQAIVSMNGAYSVVYGILNSSKEIKRVAVTLPAETDVNAVMRSLYAEKQKQGSSVSVTGSGKKYNLIYILMEGWPRALMSAYGYTKPTTPFFASLKEKAIAPNGVISGGLRTTEGIYSIFCSQQNPLGKTVSQTSLQNNQYECMPSILKKQGWHTAFFQGTHKETSGTGAFAQSVGFSESFGKEDMPEGRYERNYWGAQDPDVYDFVLSKLDEMPQPFIIGVNTNSTHDIKLAAGVDAAFGDNNAFEKYISVLHFADQSMQEFFEKIKHKPYFNNTIFVLVSDHTGGNPPGIAGRFLIPGIIYAPELLPAASLDIYVSQRDFSPTVLDILGLPASSTFAGKSFWPVNNYRHVLEYFDSGVIGWLAGDTLIKTSVANPDDLKCYSIADGWLQASEISCDEKDKEQSINSLVFTSYSQDLLFKGRTKQFYQFLEED